MIRSIRKQRDSANAGNVQKPHNPRMASPRVAHKSPRIHGFEQSFSSGNAVLSHCKFGSVNGHAQLEREAEFFSERMIHQPQFNIQYKTRSSPQNPGSQKHLPGNMKNHFETYFGYDFSNVMLQTGATASRETKQAGARAITVGNTIKFAHGKYQPDTLQGRKLIAHELTHIVQQDPEHESDSLSNAPYGVPQYAKDDGLTVGPFEDLQSERFSGVPELERAYDDKTLIFNGRSGDFVAIIQDALQDFGFPLPDHGLDGIFGSETESKVLEFQKAAGATMLDGIVGPETMNLLDQWALKWERKEKQSFLQMARNKLTDESEICLLNLFERHVNGDSIDHYYMNTHQVQWYATRNLGDNNLPEFTYPHPKYTKPGFNGLDKHFNESIEEFLNGGHGIKGTTKSIREGISNYWRLRNIKSFYHAHMITIDFLTDYFFKRTKNKNDVYSCFAVPKDKRPWWREIPGIYYPIILNKN
ncbi:MAG: DUF4157 domain-containing protein [Candidatus Marinimicrobia bacterium]|nr:DUF4157 domain-containing protein [Candidatus Neomarinimicrobiota bacterium]